MLDAPPREPRWLSWLYVVLASLVIFATVPFGRAIQNAVAGQMWLLYLAFAIAAALLFLLIRFLRQRRISPVGYFWLLSAGVAFAAYAYSLRGNPIETVHFVEYGLLSLLIYRALVHSVRDWSIHVTAVLIVGIVGIVDEWFQWVVPSRFWDLRDVQINVVAGALVQLAIGAGLRPALVAGRPSSRNLSYLCFVAAICVSLLGLSFANTPDRIASYATRIPSLSFLLSSRSMMVEYGYLYEDPDIGIFRSRFTPDELAANDRDRGLQLADVLDRYISDEMFGEFQDVYSVPRDAYIHEAGVHLFRRNRYLQRADAEERRRYLHYNIAHRENQILERYFPTGLIHSSHLWDDTLRKRVEDLADTEPVYESRVSLGLITRVGETQVLTGFGIAVALLLVAGTVCYRRQPDTERSARDSSQSHD